jgi:hypothetical protein
MVGAVVDLHVFETMIEKYMVCELDFPPRHSNSNIFNSPFSTHTSNGVIFKYLLPACLGS